MQQSKTYLVGGAVRDKLLGVTHKDLDYVVVGSTPDKMLEQGFTSVGNSFPVFIHPTTREEYALARTEKSTGIKYQDFECYFGEDVTIEDDLLRRDLTINSMAFDEDTGKVIDPYGGVNDIINKQLHPTSEAFKEDAVRVLRAARFNAKYPEFKYTPLLQKYCDQMYVRGDLDKLVPERVQNELLKTLNTTKPSVFFSNLRNYRLFSTLDKLWGVPQRLDHHPESDTHLHCMLAVDYAAKVYKDPEITFSVLLHDLGKYPAHINYGNAYGHEELGVELVKDFCDKLKIPNNYRDLAVLVCKYHGYIHGVLGRGSNNATTPKSIMKLFQETKALQKPERFKKILSACICDARGRGATPEQRLEFENKPYPQEEYLLECLEAVTGVDTSVISKKYLEKGVDGVIIGEQIRVARIDSIREVYNRWKNLNKNAGKQS